MKKEMIGLNLVGQLRCDVCMPGWHKHLAELVFRSRKFHDYKLRIVNSSDSQALPRKLVQLAFWPRVAKTSASLVEVSLSSLVKGHSLHACLRN